MLAYAITELGLPEDTGEPIATCAYDINDSGVAVGYSDDWYIEPGGIQQNRACRWSDGGSPEFVPGAPVDGSAAYAVNTDGEIVGRMHDYGPNVGAFFFKDSQLHDLASVLGPSVGVSDVNSFGVVCGGVGPTASRHPFTYDTYGGGQAVHLNPPAGYTVATASWINDSGHVVGTAGPWGSPDRHVFLYRDGQMEDLGEAVSAEAINASDVVTGQKIFPNAPAATAYRLDASGPGKQFDDLGQSEVVGFNASVGCAINGSGSIVGYSYGPPGLFQERAFVHIADGPDAGFHDLQDLVVDGDGWELSAALGINVDEAIVGYGLHDGDLRGWLATPVDPLAAQTKALEEEIAEAVLAWLMILGGARGGGPGVGITPGGKPVPIPPHEWKLRWQRMPAAERDAYAGLAVRAVASTLQDRERRSLLSRAATEVVDSALSELDQHR